jgi:hypothetical protein
MPKTLGFGRIETSVLSTIDKHEEYLNQNVRTTSSPSFVNMNLTGNMTIGGSLTVQGGITNLDTIELNITDNIIVLNSDESGAGITLNQSGIEIERGSLENFRIVYDETDDFLKSGPLSNLKRLPNIEYAPTQGRIAAWNDSLKQVDFVTTLTPALTFTNTTNSNDLDTGSMIINGGVSIKKNAYLGQTLFLQGASNTFNSIGSTFLNDLNLTSNNNINFFLPSNSGITMQSNRIFYYGNNNRIFSDGTDFFVISTGDLYLTTAGNKNVNLATGSKLSLGDINNRLYYNGTDTFLEGSGMLNVSFTDTRIGSGNKLSFGTSNNFIHSTASNLILQSSSVETPSIFSNTNTTESTTSVNGAVILSGGMGIAKNIHVNGIIYADNVTNSTNDSSGSLITSGGLGVKKDAYIGGKLFVVDTTDSSSSITGALVVSGGVGIVKNLTVGGVTNFSELSVVTSSGRNFTVSGSGNVDMQVSGITTIGSISNNFNLQTTVAGNLSLNSVAQINLTSGTTATINSTGIVTMDSTSGVKIESANTAYGVKIGVDSAQMPVFIGNINSETRINDNLTVLGNLTVMGDRVELQSLVTTINDNAILLNNAVGSLSDSGILVKRYQPPNSGSLGEVVNETSTESSSFQTPLVVNLTSAVLNASASVVNDYYSGWWIKITSGAGAGTARRIKTYNGSTKEIIIYTTGESDGLAFITQPENGVTYELFNKTYSSLYFNEASKEWRFGYSYSDSGSGSILLSGYANLRCKNIIVEEAIISAGYNSNGQVIVTNTSGNAIVVRKETSLNPIFNFSTVDSDFSIQKDNATIGSKTIFSNKIFNSSSVYTTFSSIETVLTNGLSGSETGKVEFNVVKDQVLNNLLTLEGNNLRVNVPNTQDAISSVTGAVITAGGLGVAKSLYVGTSIFENNVRIVSAAGSNLSKTGNTLDVISNPTFSGVTTITNTTDSVSSVTGAVITAGGLGVAKALYVGTTIFENNVRIVSAAGSNLSKTGNTLDVVSNPTFSGVTTIANTTDSVSSVTGAVITAGGLGVAKALYVGTTIFENNVRIISAAGSNLSKTGNTLDVVSNPTFSGVTTITNTTDSVSSATGAVIIAGGLGVAKSLYIGGILNVVSTTESSNTTSGSVIISGGTGIAKSLYVGGTLNVVSTTESSNTTTGSVIISGGAGIAKNLYVGGNIVVSGNISGNVATPTLTALAQVNIDSVSLLNPMLSLNGVFKILNVVANIIPTATDIFVEFEMVLPNISGNFSATTDINLNYNGFHGDNYVNNIIIKPVIGTTKIKISFLAGSLNNHIIRINNLIYN